MPKIKVNNINLYYETCGSGKPIIFIAGFSANHLVRQPIIQYFSKQ